MRRNFCVGQKKFFSSNLKMFLNFITYYKIHDVCKKLELKRFKTYKVMLVLRNRNNNFARFDLPSEFRPYVRLMRARPEFFLWIPLECYPERVCEDWLSKVCILGAIIAPPCVIVVWISQFWYFITSGQFIYHFKIYRSSRDREIKF